MKLSDKDIYYDNISINCADTESQRELEFIILEKEKEIEKWHLSQKQEKVLK